MTQCNVTLFAVHFILKLRLDVFTSSIYSHIPIYSTPLPLLVKPGCSWSTAWGGPIADISHHHHHHRRLCSFASNQCTFQQREYETFAYCGLFGLFWRILWQIYALFDVLLKSWIVWWCTKIAKYKVCPDKKGATIYSFDLLFSSSSFVFGCSLMYLDQYSTRR